MAATFVKVIFRNFGWDDNVKSFFWVEWYSQMGMSYLTSLNTQLFKNIAYVGPTLLGLSSILLFNLIFNVNSNLAESSAKQQWILIANIITSMFIYKLYCATWNDLDSNNQLGHSRPKPQINVHQNLKRILIIIQPIKDFIPNRSLS